MTFIHSKHLFRISFLHIHVSSSTRAENAKEGLTQDEYDILKYRSSSSLSHSRKSPQIQQQSPLNNEFQNEFDDNNYSSNMYSSRSRSKSNSHENNGTHRSKNKKAEQHWIDEYDDDSNAVPTTVQSERSYRSSSLSKHRQYNDDGNDYSDLPRPLQPTPIKQRQQSKTKRRQE